jgi:hypothetical protein
LEVWIPGITKVLVTISEILTAGIAIIAFSLLIYALTFNLRNRVAQSFAVILFCVVIIFSAEAFGSTSQTKEVIDFWLHVQWIGIIFLPAGFAHFSNSLLSTTGKPSRWRRLWWVRGTYLIALGFLVLLTSGLLLGPVVVNQAPAPFNKQTIFTELYILYYLVILVLSWVNFLRAYRRTVTKASRRRMSYLIISALAPAFGSFPFLLYGSHFAAQHPATFWIISIVVNLVMSVLLVVMAYAVAFFGVPWPDRVIKSRLIKWLLRGPLTASITLALVTLVRRGGDAFGYPYTALVPIIMVVNILVCEHAITLFFPKLEQALLFGNEQQELMQIRALEERLITRSDLNQFLEMVLSAICDQVQAKGGYLASINEEGIDIAVQTGDLKIGDDFTDSIQVFVSELQETPEPAIWNRDLVFALKDGGAKPEVVGYLGLRGVNPKILEEVEIKSSVQLLNHRAAIAMRDSKIQEQVISTLENIDPHVEMIQQLRAVGRYDSKGVLSPENSLEQKEMAQWIKDALTHYWGGPKLTENPLLNLNIVKQGMAEHEENPTNSLRGILKKAIETMRPDGERKFTGEWLLYNILDLKFLEGKKVKEISRRLAVSEADLYRKQRVAIDAVANEIVKMELETIRDNEERQNQH